MVASIMPIADVAFLQYLPPEQVANVKELFLQHDIAAFYLVHKMEEEEYEEFVQFLLELILDREFEDFEAMMAELDELYELNKHEFETKECFIAHLLDEGKEEFLCQYGEDCRIRLRDLVAA